jgi:DNA-binding transcriptional MocR family regulator
VNRLSQIFLDKESGTPLYRQLSDGIHALIASGDLPPEYKLPPIRQMAASLGVNNATVVSAYKYLESRKHVYSLIGSGTYVAKPGESVLPPAILKNEYTAAGSVSGDINRYINFADTATTAELFPVGHFKKAFDAVLTRDGGSAFDYQDSQGYAPLRESICGLCGVMSVKTSPDRIQIVSGAQQGLDILAKALLNPGDTLLVERPTFYGAVGAFASRGALVIEIPLGKNGPDPALLETLLKTHRPKAMYLMPNFQTPTGISYSAETKRQVLELAYRYGSYIIEEDSQNDFYYGKQPPVPMKALDYRSQVIYVKSFSKILMPGLRMGFMVCPRKVHVTTAKRNTDIATSGYIQRAFDFYLRDGGFEGHLQHMRAVYGRRFRKAVKAAERHLTPYVDFYKPEGGLSLWLTVKDLTDDVETLCGKFLQQRVIVSPGTLFISQGDKTSGFRISFANLPEGKIAEGIELIAAVLSDAL